MNGDLIDRVAETLHQHRQGHMINPGVRLPWKDESPEVRETFCEEAEAVISSIARSGPMLKAAFWSDIVPQNHDIIHRLYDDYLITLNSSDLVVSWGTIVGVFETDLIKLLRSLCHEGMVYVDVGANVGVHCLHVSQATNNKCKIHAYEPFPENIRRLRDTINLSQLSDVIILHPYALGAHNGTIHIDLPDASNFGSPKINSEGKGTKIEIHRFDDVFEGDCIDVLKIDIEAAEGLWLEGARQTLERTRPTIISEFGNLLQKGSGIDPSDYLQYFFDLKYKIKDIETGKAIKPRTNLERVFARKGFTNILMSPSN